MTALPPRLLAPLLISFLLLAGCQSAPAPRREPTQVLTRLYFGLSRPGGLVSAEEFDAFVAEEVTPRFPSGFTLLEAQGAWQDRASGETKREGSRVLEVLHEEGGHEEGGHEEGGHEGQAQAAFEELIERYKERFQQQSVLQVDLPAKARF